MVAAGTVVLVVLVVIMLLKGVWVRLLAAQKPINRPGWWKGKFALFQMLATGAGGRMADISPKACPTHAERQGVRAL